MSAYYNEIDKYCCAWLKNLMAADLIPAGDVDDRPIQEVKPDDLTRYTQCHFFAGIGGWAYAARLAGWPDDRPIWTGSCPCQPFSVAGKQRGFDDPRHLWPEWFSLIALSHPPTIFGEQVASASDWFARVRGDLEGAEYAVAKEEIEAACAGAAQYRDRLWFVAECNDSKRRTEESGGNYSGGGSSGRPQSNGDTSECSAGLLASGQGERRNRTAGVQGPHGRPFTEAGRVVPVADELGQGLEERQGVTGHDGEKLATGQRNSLLRVECASLDGWGEGWTESEFRSRGFTAAVASLPSGTQFIECPDGKWRRLPPPRVRWLGNGIPARVAKLRALGNSIYPPLAATFIRAYQDAILSA